MKPSSTSLQTISNIPNLEQARSDFIAWCDFSLDVKPFEFGVTRFASTSDLDLGILIQNGINQTNAPLIKQKINNLPHSVKSAMNTGTLMVFESKPLTIIDYVDDIKLNFFNESFPLKKMTTDLIPFRLLSQIFDWLPERIGKLNQPVERNIEALKRQNGVLYSTHYTFEKIIELTGNVDYWKREYVNSVVQLRNEWVHLNINEIAEWQLYLVDLANKCFIESCHEISDYCEKKEIYSDFKYGDSLALNSYTQITIGNKPKIKRSQICELDLPSVFLLSYANLASKQSSLSTLLRKRLNAKLQEDKKLPHDFRNYLDHRSLTIIKIFEPLKKYKFSTGAYKFGWYLNE